MTKPHRDSLQGFFEQSGIHLSPQQLDQFSLYYELLIAHNDALDLTRLRSLQDVAIKHFVDSVYFTEFVELPSPLIDIGSGAGFPGIPLKIYMPGLEIILSEPRKKRASFLEMAAKELRLGGLSVYPHMVTLLTDFPVRCAITRALEPIDDTLSRVRHFLPDGGKVIFMKGPGADVDLDGIGAHNSSAYSLESDRHYTLPRTDYERRIIVFKKESGPARKTYAILKDLTATAGAAVTSSENRSFRELKRLAAGDTMKKRSMVLVSGRKIIAEIAKARGTVAMQMIVRDGHEEEDAEMNALIGEFAGRSSLLVLKKSLFNEVDPFNTAGPLMTVGMPEMKRWDLTSGPGCTLLLPFQDPSNVGAAIRSAAGFGVETIVMLKEAAHPFHPKSIRASAGYVFNARIETGPSIHELGKIMDEGGAQIVTLDSGGTPLSTFAFPDRFLLIPGIEGPGLPGPLKARAVSIPLGSGVESLNAPVALSIALYEWRRQSPSN